MKELLLSASERIRRAMELEELCAARLASQHRGSNNNDEEFFVLPRGNTNNEECERKEEKETGPPEGDAESSEEEDEDEEEEELWVPPREQLQSLLSRGTIEECSGSDSEYCPDEEGEGGGTYDVHYLQGLVEAQNDTLLVRNQATGPPLPLSVTLQSFVYTSSHGVRSLVISRWKEMKTLKWRRMKEPSRVMVLPFTG